MSALTFSLRDQPAQRLDLSPLVPEWLAPLSENDIARIEIGTTRMRVCVGDIFTIRAGDANNIRFDGGSERFDRVGAGMSNGAIHIEGDVGMQPGRLMRGGKLVVRGNAGPWAASGMRGGVIEIGGNAAERLGGPLAGETVGMRGGIVIVRGHAGERAGDKMRRGTIAIEGDAGAYAGSRMIAGTLIVRGRAGALPGYLMARGTLVLAGGGATVPPTFADCGVHNFVTAALMATYFSPFSARIAALLRQPWRRLVGDMAAVGKGEIFFPPV